MRRRAAVVVLALCTATGACKDKQQATPAPSQAPATTPHAAGNRPTLPSPAPQPAEEPAAGSAKPPGKPIAIADAKAVLPPIQGTEVIALKPTSDNLQIHGTWCIDGTSADDVAHQVGEWLTKAGYTELSTRGDARKAGVAGTKGDVRFSMVVSASSASVCAAPAHYFASATIYHP